MYKSNIGTCYMHSIKHQHVPHALNRCYKGRTEINIRQSQCTFKISTPLMHCPSHINTLLKSVHHQYTDVLGMTLSVLGMTLNCIHNE